MSLESSNSWKEYWFSLYEICEGFLSSLNQILIGVIWINNVIQEIITQIDKIIKNFSVEIPTEIEELKKMLSGNIENFLDKEKSKTYQFYDTEASWLELYRDTLKNFKEKYKNEEKLLAFLISIEAKFNDILKAIYINNLEVKITHMQNNGKLKTLLKQLKEQKEVEEIRKEEDEQKKFQTRSAIRGFLELIRKYKDFFPENREYQAKIENFEKQFKGNYKKLLEEVQWKTSIPLQVKSEQLDLFEPDK